MKRVTRWCTLAGIVAGLAGLVGLTVPASAASGWTQVTPAGLAAGSQNYLNGSFALSSTDAWAVGESETTSTGAEAPLVVNWNGTAWSTVPTPAPSGSTPEWLFKGVGASSASDAWAVGEQSSGTKIHDSLYEHWNGTAWSVVTGPNEGVLYAVVDFSPTNAYAFAASSALHWNGTAWSVVSGGLPSLQVSADSPDDIWGIYRDDQVIHYNGTSWTATTLSSSSGTPVFESVVALSPSDVWVAGTNGTVPLLFQFNGTSWQQKTLPSSFSSYGLNAITAQSASDVWVFSNTGTPDGAPLLANWNGSSWTTSADPLPADTEFSIGQASSSPGYAWLFGTYLNATTGFQPLILQNP
jgi:hypothetical protein